MSLADELLADLEEIDAEEEAQWGKGASDSDESQEGDDDDGFAAPDVGGMDTLEDMKNQSIKAFAKLSTSKKFQSVMDRIGEFRHKHRTDLLGAVETDPEYALIVEANNIVVDIDNEIGVIHKYVRDLYAKRFPELEKILVTPLEFLLTVLTMKNEMDTTKIDLTQVLAPAAIMVVSVTATTSKGEPLNDDELTRTIEACEMAVFLSESKSTILQYVESRMFLFAPNVTHICGPSTAAKLMGTAGGLTNLSRMPACNILLLGAQKRTLAGFSSTAMLPHTGYIYYCDLVQSQPPDWRRKCAKVVAGKVALAARVDSFHDKDTHNGIIGIQFRDYIQHNIEKAQEPPPAKMEKALPRPDEIHGKKRAGKRVKRLRDRTALTRIREQANRMTFGLIEEDIIQDEMGFSTGQLGKDTGHVRAIQSTQRKSSVSKKLQKELSKGGMSTIRSGTNTSGLASVAFTPFQGLEIHNPKASEQKVAEANAKYFGKAGFDFANKRPKTQ